MRGRDLQRDAGQAPQSVLMVPILEGLDGVQKMSKSLGNAIAIQDTPAEMYGKLMSISDVLMWRYWTLLTDKRTSEIDAMYLAVQEGQLHPMGVKKELAASITRDFHGADAAERAATNWAKQFQERGQTDDMPVVHLHAGDETLVLQQEFVDEDGAKRSTKMLNVERLLHAAGLAASVGEARRKIAENAVSIDGAKFRGKTKAFEDLQHGPQLQIGRRQVHVIWS